MKTKDLAKQRPPLQPLLGLALGVMSGVVYPGFFFVMFPPFIPAIIAGILSVKPQTRSLAAGFAAASIGWLAYYFAVACYSVVASAFR